MKNNSFKRHTPRNLFTNILSFVVNVLVGLWLVPYLIEYLGNAAYGLIPLAMVFTEYISVISVSINGSIARFLTINIQNNDWNNANKTFNTAFFALLVLVFVQFMILGYVTIDLKSLVNVPESLVRDAYYLFAFTFLAYLISLISSVFSTSMYAYNRLDIILSANIVRNILRLVIIVFLFLAFEPSLKFVGIANFIGSLVILLASLFYWRRLTPAIKVNYKFYDPSILKEITGMGGWLIVNQVGYLLFLKIDLFVVNRFIGPNEGGEYAAIQQWSALIRTMSGILSGVIGPIILISFAKGNITDVVKFGKIGVKFLTIAIGVITGVICGFSSELLTVWLGKDFAQLSNLLIVMLCHLTINLGVLPLLPINTAMNRVKVPGIVTLFMGILNLILAVMLVLYTDFGYIGVALAGMIVLTLKNGFFSPWYASKILNIQASTFFKQMFTGIVMFLITFFASNFLGDHFIIDNWIGLIAFSSIIGLVSILIIWVFLLNRDEKKIALNIILRKQ